MLGNFRAFCRLLIFFSKYTFSKNSFRNTIRVSISLDPGQARHFVGPGLDPNCLQRLSSNDTSNIELELQVRHFIIVTEFLNINQSFAIAHSGFYF